MTIRKYRTSDFETLREITGICFDGISIDQNIERRYGIIAGRDWRYRKKRHIDADVQAHSEGIFLAEVEGKVVGFISTRVDRDTRFGWIPNFAVLPVWQKKGIGTRLMATAMEYLKGQGMEYVRIEALEQNSIATRIYPKMGFAPVANQIHYVMPVREWPHSGPVS
jgi:ribosomal protein S18 acetylase RimI-like enzyme